MKTLLSFFGQIFFAVLAILGIGLLLFYMNLTDTPGILRNLAQRVQAEFSQTTATLEGLNIPDLTNPDSPDVQITVVGSGKMEKTDLLPAHSLPIVPTQSEPVMENLVPVPEPTFTPIPPMDPLVYQTEATIRLKRFAASLERWMVSNDRLMLDDSLMQDAAWREEVTANLDAAASEGQLLANIGQPPEQHAEIDGWLVRAGLEADRLQAYYLQGLETGSPNDFASAADSFTRIKKFLAEAAQRMLLAGWEFEP